MLVVVGQWIMHSLYTSMVPATTLADGNFLFFFWSFCFVLCFFRKIYFHFLTNLKYTGRLIAGSLSIFISKIQHKLALGTLIHAVRTNCTASQ